MSLSAIIATIVVVIVLWYVVLIIWDLLKSNQNPNKIKYDTEEAIDISNDLENIGFSPISIDAFPVQEQNNEGPESNKTPFPWTVDKFCDELDKLILGEECQELEDVIIFTSQRIYN